MLLTDFGPMTSLTRRVRVACWFGPTIAVALTSRLGCPWRRACSA